MLWKIAGTSALPPKADIQIMISGQAPANVRFAPNSGHSGGDLRLSPFGHLPGMLVRRFLEVARRNRAEHSRFAHQGSHRSRGGGPTAPSGRKI